MSFSSPFWYVELLCFKYILIMINFLQGEFVRLDDAIIGTSCNSPYVAAFGPSLADLTDPVVVVEKSMFRMPSMEMAVVCGFFSYYIYNIQYPPSLRQFFIFFESIFNIKLSSTLPICVSVFLDSLFKV